MDCSIAIMRITYGFINTFDPHLVQSDYLMRDKKNK